jgi:hypothetical protein
MATNISTFTPTITPASFLTPTQIHSPIKAPTEIDLISTSISNKTPPETSSILSDISSTASSQTILPELWSSVTIPRPSTPKPDESSPKKKFNREEYQRN